jgi:hypothetical protein
MHIVIAGSRYELIYTNQLDNDCDGLCDKPTVKGKAIRVRETLKDQRRMEVEIHEMLHATDWSKDEEWVDQTAKDISAVLWRLGYRLPEKVKK